MKWLRYLAISLISFGFGVIFTYLLQGHPTFESIMNFIAGGVSLGLIIEVIGMLREWLKERKDAKLKACERLEAYLLEHSRDLVNGVLKKWFEHDFTFLSPECSYDTSLARAYYKPHLECRIEEPSEPYRLGKNLVEQTVEHLRAKEYAEIWNIWLECKRLVKTHLEKVVKMWESIEEKLVTNIPKEFMEWNARGVNPPTCFLLENTVWEIYREAELFKATGKFEETSFKKDTEKDYFRVGTSTLYARSPDESLIDEFIDIVCGIVTDQSLIERLKMRDAEKQAIDNSVEKYRQAIDKVVDDFDKGHINLKGICRRCESWYDE